MKRHESITFSLEQKIVLFFCSVSALEQVQEIRKAKAIFRISRSSQEIVMPNDIQFIAIGATCAMAEKMCSHFVFQLQIARWCMHV